MKNSFTAEQLRDPRIVESARILSDCVHYGFCASATCPTYVLTGDENESPRGRIDLIRAMLEKGGTPDPETVRHIDQCLSCLSCMSTCAAQVDYAHLIDHARVHIETNHRRSWFDRLSRDLIARVMPHPRRLRRALNLAGLARPFRSVLPARLGSMLALAPSRVAPPLPERRVSAAEGPSRARVGILPGCVQQIMAPEINRSASRLLQRTGCEVVELDVACCGGLTLHMGREEEARASARDALSRWMREWRNHGLDAIVVTASGCGSTMKDYAHLFPPGTSEHDDAKALAAIVFDISEFLAENGIGQTTRSTGLSVAYHDPCSLQHGQRITAPPRELLNNAGFQVLDIAEKHFCCGSAGTYNMLQPEAAAQLGRRKARSIEATGVGLVATGNLGCIAQIGQYLNVPILHTVQLLDWATGGPPPAGVEDMELRPAPPVQSDGRSKTGEAIW